jgi:hypothetical protein
VNSIAGTKFSAHSFGVLLVIVLGSLFLTYGMPYWMVIILLAAACSRATSWKQVMRNIAIACTVFMLPSAVFIIGRAQIDSNIRKLYLDYASPFLSQVVTSVVLVSVFAVGPYGVAKFVGGRSADRFPWKIIVSIAGLHQAARLLLMLASVDFFVLRPDAVLHEQDAASMILYNLWIILGEPTTSFFYWLEGMPDSWDFVEDVGNSLLWGVVFGYVLPRSKIRLNKGQKNNPIEDSLGE